MHKPRALLQVPPIPKNAGIKQPLLRCSGLDEAQAKRFGTGRSAISFPNAERNTAFGGGRLLDS
jgi:hypothetical protein